MEQGTLAQTQRDGGKEARRARQPRSGLGPALTSPESTKINWACRFAIAPLWTATFVSVTLVDFCFERRALQLHGAERWQSSEMTRAPRHFHPHSLLPCWWSLAAQPFGLFPLVGVPANNSMHARVQIPKDAAPQQSLVEDEYFQSRGCSPSHRLALRVRHHANVGVFVPLSCRNV